MIVVSTKVASFDPTDAASLSNAYADAYSQIPQLVDFFRNYIKGFATAYLEEIAPMIGVRESRRILGEYVLTGDDVRTGREFADGVAMGAYHIDVHRPDGTGFDSQPTLPYDIPYRCLLVRDVQNLLVAGKCVSATHEAIASTRVIPICMAEGQAAGIAAAMSLQSNVELRGIDVAALQQELRTAGALLRDGLRPQEDEVVAAIGAI
jgi:hypothetical protein